MVISHDLHLGYQTKHYHSLLRNNAHLNITAIFGIGSMRTIEQDRAIIP